MKRIILPALILLILSSCNENLNIRVNFRGETDIMPRAVVMIEDTVIGRVVKVEYDGACTDVDIAIDDNYRDRMTDKTMFFRVRDKDGEKIMVIVSPDKDKLLTDGEVVSGMGEMMYYALRAGRKVKEKVQDFMASEEWIDFRENFKERVKNAYESAKEEIDREANALRNEIEEFAREMNLKYGDEAGTRIESFADSVIKEEEQK